MDDKVIIGIVTVLYNSSKVLDEYFESLEKQDFKNIILFIVDNKSTDDSLEKAKKLSKNVSFECVFIENDENFGVAKGNNQGVVKAKERNCDYILLSNNDVVLKKDTISILYRTLCDKSLDMIVPKILFYKSNLINQVSGKFNLCKASTTNFGYGKKDNGFFDKVGPVKYATTCFMLMRTALFDEVGMFDEKYFVYYDDSDFVWRALKMGKSLWIDTNSILEHKESYCTGGAKSDFSVYYVHRNMIYFVYKCYPFIYRNISILYQLIRCLIKYYPNKRTRKLVRKAFSDGFTMVKEIK